MIIFRTQHLLMSRVRADASLLGSSEPPILKNYISFEPAVQPSAPTRSDILRRPE